MSHAASASIPALYAPFAAVARALRGAMRAVMVARMTQVLYAMSDARLAEIGLTRAEIPDHARRMMDLPR